MDPFGVISSTLFHAHGLMRLNFTMLVIAGTSAALRACTYNGSMRSIGAK